MKKTRGRLFQKRAKTENVLEALKKNTNIQKIGQFLTIFEKQSPLKQRLCSNNRTFRKK